MGRLYKIEVLVYIMTKVKKVIFREIDLIKWDISFAKGNQYTIL